MNNNYVRRVVSGDSDRCPLIPFVVTIPQRLARRAMICASTGVSSRSTASAPFDVLLPAVRSAPLPALSLSPVSLATQHPLSQTGWRAWSTHPRPCPRSYFFSHPRNTHMVVAPISVSPEHLRRISQHHSVLSTGDHRL